MSQTSTGNSIAACFCFKRGPRIQCQNTKPICYKKTIDPKEIDPCHAPGYIIQHQNEMEQMKCPQQGIDIKCHMQIRQVAPMGLERFYKCVTSQVPSRGV